MYGRKKSELTADRAGVIACGGIDYLVNQMVRFMGAGAGNKYVDVTLEGMLEQHQDFDESKAGIVSKLIYFQQTAFTTHPWTIHRVREAVEWFGTKQYNNIKGGMIV